jgi:hypothetical protein
VVILLMKNKKDQEKEKFKEKVDKNEVMVFT